MVVVNKKLKFDVVINILFPILLGIVIYLYPMHSFIRNYVPDGLWAYALTNAIFIIWDRKIKVGWLIVVFISFFLFEFLQKWGIIAGTFDYLDIVAYVIFSSLAIISNKLYT